MDATEARIATSRECLDLADEIADDASDSLVLSSRLRARGHSPELVAAALTQAGLRRAAQPKLGEFAARMAFTRAGLEQASRLNVAALHAGRFRAAGIERVADITAGIGVDAIAFAGIGISVMAFERDEATAVIADHNLSPFPDAVVVHADAMPLVRDVDVQAVFADPARRAGASRKHRPQDYEPPLAQVLALRDTYPAVGIKLGPGVPHDALPADAEAEWVSVDGAVVECGLWCGPLARAAGRAALVVTARDGGAVRIPDSGATADAGVLGEYLLEPDGAVIRAGLAAEIAASCDGRLLHPTIAYVTTDSDVAVRGATRYRVLDSLPYKEAALASYLRERGVGAATIKKRGMDVDPDALRKRLKLKGDARATVILTRVGERRLAILVEGADDR